MLTYISKLFNLHYIDALCAVNITISVFFIIPSDHGTYHFDIVFFVMCWNNVKYYRLAGACNQIVSHVQELMHVNPA